MYFQASIDAKGNLLDTVFFPQAANNTLLQEKVFIA
jgi:hypothetical protein